VLGNAILYLFRKYLVVANDVFTERVPTASQFITLYHTLFNAGIYVIFSVVVGYYLLEVYVLPFFFVETKDDARLSVEAP
jgi:hypothetical protein